MPEKQTVERARRDLKQGKSASTAAGEFVHEEIEHVRRGQHGARSTKQAIAIGLSKARRAGVPLDPPAAGEASAGTRRSAKRDVEAGQGQRKRRPSAKRSRATTRALKREPRAAASSKALSRQAKTAAARRRSAKASSTSAGTSRRQRPRAASAAAKRRSSAPSKRPATPQRRRSSGSSRRTRAPSATA